MTRVPSRTPVTAKRPQPQAHWVCGYVRAGRACTQGPSASGKCCLQQTELGEFDEGIREELGPCIPERTAWFARQTLAINTAILVGGILLLLMTIPQREQVFVPGSLSKPHAQILGNRMVSQRCSLCHPNSNAIVKNLTQQDLCLNCHAQQMPDAHLGNPHDLTDEQLQALLQPAKGSSKPRYVSYRDLAESDPDALRGVAVRQAAHQSSTRCATCHIEHKGGAHDLKAITNTRCQSCHSQQFASFANGHPQFKNYPYRSQRRIAFDHQSHALEYYPKKQAEFECSTCHVDTDNRTLVGNVFRGVGFEKACASCHQDSIEAGIVDGWAMLQVPCILPEDKQDARLGLQDWPQDATFDYDGELSVVMRLLLSADPDCREVLGEVPSSGKLTDIAPASRADTIRTLARGFRKLVGEVAKDGQLAWKQRLTKGAEIELGRNLNAYETDLVTRLSQGLPPDLFRTVERRWFQFPSAKNAQQSAESARQMRLVASQDDLLLAPEEDDSPLRSWQNAPETNLELRELQGAEHLSGGGFYLDSTLLTLTYMPQGHADPLLSSWNEFVHHLADAGSPLQANLQALTPGGCVECHILQSNEPLAGKPNVSQSLKWQSIVRNNSISRFTKFDHTPHLTLPTLTDCTYCHQFNPKQRQTVTRGTLLVDRQAETNKPGYELDKQQLREEFTSMRISQCAACHRPGGANDGCTQCHNYHVGAAGFEASH